MNALRTSLVFSLLVTTASAQFTLIVPADVDAVTDGVGSTAYPFDRDSATAANNDIRVQYVYDSSNFPGITGPILINQLRFRANATTASWAGGSYSNFVLRIGAAGVDYSAATTSWAGNYLGGTEPAPTFQGAVTIPPGMGNGAGVPGPWFVTINLPTPVSYDPSQGNDLIVDLAHDGVFTGGTSDGVITDSGRNACARIYNLTDWQAAAATSVQQSVGLTCEIGYAPPNGTFPSFTVDKTRIGPGETVTFTDTTFSSSGIAAWAWDFDNDGTVDSRLQNPQIPFPLCGTFDPTLQVLDNQGNQPSITRTGLITVGAPVADFSFTLAGNQTPFTVQLADTSTAAPTGWAWDFDNDGTVDSTAQNPAFQIATAGVQTCRLTVSNACGTDSTTLDIDTRAQLCTQYTGGAAWNNGSSFSFDLNVTNPAGVTIEALGVNISTTGIRAGLEVYIKPGSYVGSDTDRNAWALVASGSNPASAGPNTETLVDITDFSLAPGAWGVAVVYSLASGNFNYSTGTNTFSNADLTMTGGQTNFPAFGTTNVFQPRVWNGCVYYTRGQSAGSFHVFGDGCPGSAREPQSIGLGGAVPSLGVALDFVTEGGVANQPVAGINFGFATFPGGLDLGLIGMPGCVAWATVAVILPTPLDAAGRGSFRLAVPNDPMLLGAQFYVQPVTADPAANSTGVVVGDAGAARIGR